MMVTLILAALLWGSKTAAQENKNIQVYFDEYANCDRRHKVEPDSVFIVGAQRNSKISSGSFSSCEIFFEAATSNHRLCATITKMQFSSPDLELQFFSDLESHGIVPDQSFRQGDEQKVREICSIGREMTMKLADISEANHGNINDLVVEIQIVSMQGNKRTNFMDSDCGAVRALDNSHVRVWNRHSDKTDELPAVCQTTFRYSGKNSSVGMCLRYKRLSSDFCGYKVLVKEGDSLGSKLTYDCKTTEPSGYWCVNNTSLTVELRRDNTDASMEPSNLFSISVRDGTSGSVFNDEEEKNLPVGVIVGVVVALAVLVVIVIIAAVISVKRRKGLHSLPQEDLDAYKL